MHDLLPFLINAAHAADTVPEAQASSDVTATIMKFMPLFLVFAVFYFLLIRPQQKKLDEHTSLVKALKKGDKIVTGGGLLGTVTDAGNDDYLTVEIAPDVRVKVARTTISGLAEKKSGAGVESNSHNKKN